ncbi:MAG: 16S rRNA (guanine(527)-N(7))-methyltransferase RsmG [Gammaproteobacteria bacterium]|nr:16S rRNA (guanine(527)-N(7))-methyltransferase RsmG [Gammaproteobacteria bacterium]
MTDQTKLQWSNQLRNGLQTMGISLTENQQAQLLDYLALLVKWNQAFNLTAIRDPAEMVSRQLLDSLSILDLLQGDRILDVGTGPGLPGIPLAIACPGLEFTLLDSNSKKTRFIQQSIGSLKLKNITVVQNRVEDFQPEKGFSTITSRAFSDLLKMTTLTRHLLTSGGCWLAMKGIIPTDELVPLERQGYAVEVVVLQVPGTSSGRHAILIL